MSRLTICVQGRTDISGKEEQNQARVQILQHLVDNNEFEVPQAMVEEQLKALMNELVCNKCTYQPDDVSFRSTAARFVYTCSFAAKALVPSVQ